jgi:hypothetical protein
VVKLENAVYELMQTMEKERARALQQNCGGSGADPAQFRGWAFSFFLHFVADIWVGPNLRVGLPHPSTWLC